MENLSLEKLKRQNEALLRLAKSTAIDSGNLKLALREITEAGAATLDIKRCSVWAYTDKRDGIICLDLYEADKNEHSEGLTLMAKDFPAYFKYLTEERFLAAHDAHTDASTFEFSEIYLKPLGINSMLDAPFRRGGAMMGVICNEQVGPARTWTPEEQNFSGSLADLISRAFEAEARHKAQEELKQANELLEQKVEERTRQLSETLTQVQALKERQDADYFLTSLLINPLSRLKNSPGKIDLESLVEQKKKFSFKNRKYQIGGDFVYGESVMVGKTPHMFVLNADAMGKSIQGAGGALVLGAILKALLARPSTRPTISPGAWLSALYRRLNDVFLSLEGSMMISVSMALVDPENTAFILCAEHPAPVLLRGGIASLLAVTQIPKLGSTRDDMANDKIPLTRVRLLSGDTLFFASDGRDDIMLETAGGKVYNEDETLFCRLVEKSAGSLPRVLDNIMASGEITDDFSAIRLKVS